MSPCDSPVNSGVRRAVLCPLLLSGLCSCLHHYVYVGELKTRWEARAFCREEHADLATVDNMEDMERLIAAAPGFEGDVWIGVHDKQSWWSWSENDQSISTHNKQHFQKWLPGQPDASRTLKHVCVSMYDGLWRDQRCSMQLPFVCYNNTNTHGLPDISTERYLYVSEVKSWDAAQAHCRLHHTDLASVRSEAENTIIKQLVPSGQRVVIGLHRHTFSHWSDGTNSTFRNWVDGHPHFGTGNCVTSRIGAAHRGEWLERPCDERHHFMCHRKVKHLFILKVKALKSTISLNDPEVTDAILNQIKAGMKERGMTEGFKTTWIKKADEDIFHKEEEN